MPEDFKVFDKSPIIGGTSSTFRVHKWSLSLKEVILALIALVLLVLLIVFIALYASAEKDNSCSSLGTDAGSSAAATGGGGSGSGKDMCLTQGCLSVASRALEFMNKSESPCQNFYQYACGNYHNARPLGPNRGSRTVTGDMYQVNEDRLEAILEGPISDSAQGTAERKLKMFYQSCIDTFEREKLKGTPFLTKVVEPLGGWDLLGTWNEAQWDFNTALEKVQTDYWVDAFYLPRVFTGTLGSVIEIEPAGLGKWMNSPLVYLDTSPRAAKYRADYSKFIRRVGSLLLRDSNVELNETAKEEGLQQFVDDVNRIEHIIASSYLGDTQIPDQRVDRVTLKNLTTESSNFINWTQQLSYLLYGVVDGTTEVYILGMNYYRRVSQTILALPDTDRNRMLHNYLIWRVAEIYVQDLSFEYLHANREIYLDIIGAKNFMGVYKYCFHTMKLYMSDALGFIYARDYFTEESKDSVRAITEHLKTALQEQLDKTPWFDQSTRQYAKQKLEKATFKIGYPDWMKHQQLIDTQYGDIPMNTTDFFQNLMHANTPLRKLWAFEISHQGVSREEWTLGTVFDTNIFVMWAWNEIIAPAGLLQKPLYDRSYPHYATFGPVGSAIAMVLHHLVDEFGQHYDMNGQFMGYDRSFWTNASLQAYKKTQKCVDDLYDKVSVMTVFPYINTPRAIATTSGVKLALIGYKKWALERGLAEKPLPAVGLTNEQSVLLSFAQSECTVRDALSTRWHVMSGNLLSETRVNTLFGELKEFSDLFQCKSGDKMYHGERCDYY